MGIYGIAFGIWFGVSCYRLFEMFSIDAMHKEEEYDVSQAVYLFLTCVSAFGWPILMLYSYLVPDKDEDG